MSLAESTQPSLPSGHLHTGNLCECPECGLIQRRVPLWASQTARCGRCGAKLYAASKHSLDHALALVVASLIVFVVANLFPVLGLDIKGRRSEATLLGAVLELRAHGMNLIAGLVLFTTIVVPAMELVGVLYVLAPVKLGMRAPKQAAVYKLIHRLEPWGMLEVYLLGVLVALVKLAHMASIIPGRSLWLLGVFIFLMAATSAALNPDEIWQWLVPKPTRENWPSQAKTARCHDCGWLSSLQEHSPHCPRCGTVLHDRKPNSVGRSWALLSAAALLYLPANLLPVMVSSSFGHTQTDTILSGVVYLWVSGSWPLALIVFFASIMVPTLKLISLALLLISVQFRSQWRPVDRTRLYRVTETVGRWSMVDIFVVTMLVALVNTRPVAAVDAGPGAVAFGAVVVLTMLAAEAFDPRLIWDVLSTKDDHVR
jgi:paraquat-inducible protein A